jgi:multicomponent K+:H+ antiporter subunit E
MRRWLPYPILAASLFLMWLLLTQSFSVGQLLLALLVAVLATWAMTALRPELFHLHSLRAVLRLTGIVIVDIVRSNFAVASLILFPQRGRVSRFVSLPLDLRSNHGLTILALIVTATPGTMWIHLDRAKNTLLIHVLDLVDEEAWIQLIKARYEALLMEIFEQ